MKNVLFVGSILLWVGAILLGTSYVLLFAYLVSDGSSDALVWKLLLTFVSGVFSCLAGGLLISYTGGSDGR